MNETANDSGFLWAYHLDGMGARNELANSVNLLSFDDPGFLWVHLQSDAPDTVEWMEKQALNSKVINALTADETRPQAIPLEKGLFVVLRGVNLNPGADPDDMISIRIWLTENLMVTARKRNRKLLSVYDVRNSIDSGEAPKSTGDLLVMLSEKLADRIGKVVDLLDDDLTRVETEINDIEIAEIRTTLTHSRTQSASLKRFLAPQREALGSLLLDRQILNDRALHALRLQADRITMYVEDLELSRERAIVLQGELQNRIAEAQNEKMYVLSIVAAIFLPLSFLTGIFGMNVAGLPGTENTSAFIYLSVGMALLGLVLVLLMRWKNWF